MCYAFYYVMHSLDLEVLFFLDRPTGGKIGVCIVKELNTYCMFTGSSRKRKKIADRCDVTRWNKALYDRLF